MENFNLDPQKITKALKYKTSLFETQIMGEWLENNSCSACKGPFHVSTGHITSDKKYRICGPCYREMLPHLKRRWGGERFYDHAGPLPTEAPVGWRPEDMVINDQE